MSLLKRIEKGQPAQPGPGQPAQPPGAASKNVPAPAEPSRLAEMRMRRPTVTAATPARDAYMDLKQRVQNKLLSELDPSMDVTKTDEVRGAIEDLFDAVLAEENIILSRVERTRLFEAIVAEILGFGPLEPFIADETITEIMVNGRARSTSSAMARSSTPTRRSKAPTTSCASSIASSRRSAAVSTSPARTWMPACPTAAASMPSSRPCR